jgi:hypothetical protein
MFITSIKYHDTKLLKREISMKPLTRNEEEILKNIQILDLPAQLPLDPAVGQAVADLLTQFLWDMNRMTPWVDRHRDEAKKPEGHVATSIK